MNKNYLILGATSVVSLAVGGAATYLVTKKKLDKKYEELINVELAEAKKYYDTLYKKGDFETPEDAVKNLMTEEAAEALTSYQEGAGVEEEPDYAGLTDDPGIDEAVEEEQSGTVIRNVFKELKPSEKRRVERGSDGRFRTIEEEDPDYASEEQGEHGGPFIISKDAFLLGELEYAQVTVTYYAGDKVLADERDGVLDNHDKIVGKESVFKFGHLSDDDNIVYVRNNELTTDFEIARSMGKYSEEVLGLRD